MTTACKVIISGCLVANICLAFVYSEKYQHPSDYKGISTESKADASHEDIDNLNVDSNISEQNSMRNLAKKLKTDRNDVDSAESAADPTTRPRPYKQTGIKMVGDEQRRQKQMNADKDSYESETDVDKKHANSSEEVDARRQEPHLNVIYSDKPELKVKSRPANSRVNKENSESAEEVEATEKPRPKKLNKTKKFDFIMVKELRETEMTMEMADFLRGFYGQVIRLMGRMTGFDAEQALKEDPYYSKNSHIRLSSLLAPSKYANLNEDENNPKNNPIPLKFAPTEQATINDLQQARTKNEQIKGSVPKTETDDITATKTKRSAEGKQQCSVWSSGGCN